MNKTYAITPAISPEIFRAYDIRGIVDKNLTADSVYTIALAVGSELRERGQTQVVIARDGRLSGPTLIQALCAGLLQTGCDVIDIGCVPSPLLYFATHTLPGVNSGVMLTGSHNPTNFNGLKMVIDGVTLFGDRVQAIYQRIQAQQFVQGTGTLREEDVVNRYINRITQEIQLARPLSIVIDCGNGIPGKVAPQLFKALGCQVTELFCEVDGNFPNHHPDPSVVENLRDLITAVNTHRADIGLAFDGDGDRLGVVTNQGEIILPDRQIMLFARELLREFPHSKIVYDVKCSRNVASVVEAAGGIPMMSQTGHSVLKAKMLEIDAKFAGELSGHFFFHDRWYGFDDGLYSGARMLEIMAKTPQSSSEVFHTIPNAIATPEIQISIAEHKKFPFIKQFVEQAEFPEAKRITIDGLRVEFKNGWGLLRCSNTTPTLIARFEADDQTSLTQIMQQFRQQILKVDPRLVLPF
ncbi:MAG: phosphomannomutase/phosphoglucomutase [Legionellales bacterium]|nr:phosphomannomutase/phosphoglucomutase [Legionellales bacterium]